MFKCLLTSLVLISATACASSCATTSDPADPEVVENLVSLHVQQCTPLVDADQEVMKFVSGWNMSAEDLCRCQAKGFYQSLSQDQLDELLRAGIKNMGPGGAVESLPEPWAARMEAATQKCLIGPVEPDSLYAKCEPDSSVSSACGKYILSVIKGGESWAEYIERPPCAPEGTSDQARLDAVLDFMFAHPSLKLEAPKALVARAYKAQFCPRGQFIPRPEIPLS
jgi:hypothetical protein